MFHALPRGVPPPSPSHAPGEASSLQVSACFPQPPGSSCSWNPVYPRIPPGAPTPAGPCPPESRMRTRAFLALALRVSWFGKPFACRSAVTVGYGATLWFFWCDAGGEERVLHLRWWKAAFGIIVERDWRSLDGRRVGESEGMPRWTWMRVHLRGGRHASAARSEAAMTTTGLEPIMPMFYICSMNQHKKPGGTPYSVFTRTNHRLAPF